MKGKAKTKEPQEAREYQNGKLKIGGR